MSNELTDNQTRNIVDGINLLLCYYPEARLSVDYERQILLILPMEILEGGLPTNLKKKVEDTLKNLGWKNFDTLPSIWKYQVEDKELDTRRLVVERNTKGKLLREGLLNDDMTVEWKKQFS